MHAAERRAMVEVSPWHYEPFADLPMADPDDRHVVAAAIDAEADCI